MMFTSMLQCHDSIAFGTAVLVLVLSAYLPYVVTSSLVRCPTSTFEDDLQVYANGCLDDFRAFEDRHELTGSHLFTSVDVEVIRTLCSALRASMRCIKSLRDRCPSTKHNQIDVVVRPYLPIVELCDHQRLYEEYAMNQNCLHGQREISEMCYQTYQSDVALSTSPKHINQQQYCGFLTDLVTCVRSNFAMTCGESSAPLVELLVKATVNDSYRCHISGGGHHGQATQITMTPQKSSRLGSHRRSNAAQGLYPTTTVNRCLTVCSALSLTLTLVSFFYVRIPLFRS